MLNISALTQWIQENEGFLHPDVKIAQTEEKGLHVVVDKGRKIPRGTRIASCPMSSTLSILNVLNIAPFAGHGTQFPSAFIAKQSVATLQYFFLMEQWLLGAKSWWTPYLSTLPGPERIDDLYFLREEDVKWIAGTNVNLALTKQNEKWRTLFDAAVDQLQSLRWPNAIDERYTWQLFLWAATIFGSRSFTSQVLSDTLPADQARSMGKDQCEHERLAKLFSEGFPVLLPLLDILNYKPGAKVEWQARYSFVGLQVLDEFHESQEICNNYGPRDNETLMVGYGFAIASNPFDHFSVSLKVPPNSPLVETRSWDVDKRNGEDFKFYFFNVDHPRAKSAVCLESALFSFDLLDSISILSANDRELQTMFNSRKTYIKDVLTSNKIQDSRNLIQTIVQLYRECRARLDMLQKTNPVLRREGTTEPENQKQYYAKIYLSSQLNILITAVELCRYCIWRANSEGSNEKILQSLKTAPYPYPRLQGIEQSATSNLERLIKKHASAIQQGELLTYENLMELLPAELTSSIHQLLRLNITSGDADSASKSHSPNPFKMHLAVLLAVLESFETTSSLPKSLLPPRLDAWMCSMRSHYPPDDPNWTALTEGDHLNGTLERISHIVENTQNAHHRNVPTCGWSWCTIEKVCWGWNILGEESVMIPVSMLQLSHPLKATKERERNSNFTDVLMIYIPTF